MTNTNIPPIPQKKAPKPFGWKHLLIRVVAVLILTGILSYLEGSGTINFKMAEAKLIVPAAVGLLMAIFNWRFLVKIAIIIMPIWFAAAMAIYFAGVALVRLADLQFEQESYAWLAIVIQYLPPAIAGHWLYSGYSRMSKSISIPAYFIAVASSVSVAFFLYADYDIYLLQTVYLTVVCFALNLMHLNRISVGVKADEQPPI